MVTSRHAYCIIAHNDYYCLEKLIALVDDPRNDIFLVLDKKSELRKRPLPKTNYSKLVTPEDSQLIDIQWGGGSLMKAELLALKIAHLYGNYTYYHLLSGVDLPLKSQDYIHDFFDNVVNGKNCINFSSENHVKEVVNNNCLYLHLFTDHLRDKIGLRRKICSFIRKSFIMLQKIIRYQRRWDKTIWGKGTNWVSFNQEFTNYLVRNERDIIKRFRYVLGPDEIYKHTVFLSDGFYDSKFDGNGMIKDDARHIDWNRGWPYVWHKEDFDELMNCPELFARKFSSDADIKIIDMIYNKLKHDKNA